MDVTGPRDEPSTPEQPALALASPAGRTLVAGLVLGSSAAFLYASVVNVALPAIGDDLDVGLSGLQWIVNGYLVAMAALILVGGSAGDVLGRRRVYVASCAVLVVGSVICVAAPNLGVLVAGRLVQGIGAAGVTPISLALVDASFAEDERGRAVGLWASGSAITTAGGPFLGGVLVDSLGWRWVFALALPLLIVSAVIVARLVPDMSDTSSDTSSATARSFDPIGGVLGVVAIGGSVVALTEGLRGGWGEPVVIVSGSLALAGIAAFVPVERHRRDPMVPMRLFASRQFSGANAATALVYFALNGGFFFTAVAFQTIVGFSPSVAGAALVPANVVMILGSPVVGRLVGRFGPRWLVAGGAAVLGIGFALLAPVDAGADYVTDILPAAIVLGIGFALDGAAAHGGSAGRVGRARHRCRRGRQQRRRPHGRPARDRPAARARGGADRHGERHVRRGVPTRARRRRRVVRRRRRDRGGHDRPIGRHVHRAEPLTTRRLLAGQRAGPRQHHAGFCGVMVTGPADIVWYQMSYGLRMRRVPRGARR